MAVKLTKRGTEILWDMFRLRYMTSTQVQKLHFKGVGGRIGPKKAAERELRFLTEADYVRRIILPSYIGQGRQPYVYALAPRGAQVVAALFDVSLTEIDVRPKDLEGNYPFLSHLLATNNFYVALTQACELTGVKLVAWLDELELRRQRQQQYINVPLPGGEVMKAALIPDGLFVIEQIIDGEPLTSLCFVEVDQKTVTLAPAEYTTRSWAKKVAVYRAYFASDAYRNEFGKRVARVLAITLGRQRLNNMLAATLGVGGNYQFWFADQADACDPNQLLTSTIWSLAGDADQDTGAQYIKPLIVLKNAQPASASE